MVKLIDKFIKNKSRQNHKDFVYSLILSPNFFCDFFYKLQFCPLFFFCKFITYFAWRKTALWTQAQSVKRNIFLCLFYSRDYISFIFKFRWLCCYKSQHYFLIAVDVCQRLKASRTLVIKLKIIRVYIFLFKQYLCNRIICTCTCVCWMEVTSANVSGNLVCWYMTNKRERVGSANRSSMRQNIFFLSVEYAQFRSRLSLQK